MIKKTFLISVFVLAVAVSPAAAQSQSCTFTGGAYLYAEEEPDSDEATRAMVKNSIDASYLTRAGDSEYSEHSEYWEVDEEEEKLRAASEDNLKAYVIGTTLGEGCGEEVDVELNLSCGDNLSCEFKNEGSDSAEVSVSSGSVRKIPVNVESGTDFSMSAEEFKNLTYEEQEEIEKKLNGLVTLSWDTEIKTREAANKQAVRAFNPFSNVEGQQAIDLVDANGFNTRIQYISQEEADSFNEKADAELEKGYVAGLSYSNRNDFKQWIWEHAYARPVDEAPNTLEGYRELDVKYLTKEGVVKPDGWLKPDAPPENPMIDLTSLPEDEKWVIYPAGCITREDHNYYKNTVATEWFDIKHTGITSDQWVCGFNKPLYLPSATSDQPPSFEQD
jgi:hypothetical protein